MVVGAAVVLVAVVDGATVVLVASAVVSSDVSSVSSVPTPLSRW